MVRHDGNGKTNHDKCLNGALCNGPGCKVRSGKTVGKRSPKKVEA